MTFIVVTVVIQVERGSGNKYVYLGTTGTAFLRARHHSVGPCE
jgi:hypothetical protein